MTQVGHVSQGSGRTGTQDHEARREGSASIHRPRPTLTPKRGTVHLSLVMLSHPPRAPESFGGRRLDDLLSDKLGILLCNSLPSEIHKGPRENKGSDKFCSESCLSK